MKELMAEAKLKVDRAGRILVLSGAGLSTESGVPDFRSPNGLYSVDFHGYDPEVILSHRFYKQHTDLFYEYLRTRLNYTDIQPGISYRILADLEKSGRILGVLTQNIDSLHLTAGSHNVVELHGSLASYYCEKCGRQLDARTMMAEAASYQCACGGTIRPDVVLYDESVPKISDALAMAEQADLLLVLGTSLLVYPVAHIPMILLERDIPVVIINRDPTPYAGHRGVTEINGEIGTVLRELFPESCQRVE